MAKKTEAPDRSDYFVWKPGDLVPAGTPRVDLAARRAALLAKLPPEVRAKVEGVLSKTGAT